MALAVHDLTVHYGQLAAVSAASLSVADGEVVALLGPSGCGKSTLLRALAGLERITAGTVCWDGADLAGIPVHRRGFGLVFQDGQLFPHRDVAGNVEFGLRMLGLDRPARRARVDELLSLLSLDGYQDRPVAALSGGEQQRVALARALAPRPHLLLLDEPLSALDRALREQLTLDLARVLRVSGSTALVVTHDHDEAFTLADRVALMRAGRITQTGRPHEVWRTPADEPTARFLGCTAFLPATVHNGHAVTPLGDLDLPWAPDGEVRLGLRPHALRVDPAGPIPAEVLATVHRRDHIRLQVRTTQPLDAVAPIAAPPETGATVHLTLDPDGIAVIRK